jgi:hypothetical protein
MQWNPSYSQFRTVLKSNIIKNVACWQASSIFLNHIRIHTTQHIKQYFSYFIQYTLSQIILNSRFSVVPCFTWLSSGFSQRRPGLEPRPIHVGFVMDTVELRRIFHRALPLSSYACHSANIPYSFIYYKCYTTLATDRVVKQLAKKKLYILFWHM